MNPGLFRKLGITSLQGLRAVPVTLTLVAVMWLLFAMETAQKNPTETLFGFLPDDAIASADWITAGLTAGTLVNMVWSTLAALVFATAAEVKLGSKRFILAAFVMSALSMPIGMLAAHVVEAIGMNQWGTDLLRDAVLTPIGWIFGAAAVASASMGVVWSRRVRVALVTITVALIAFSGTMTDFVALAAVVLGLLIGKMQLGGQSYAKLPKKALRSSLREGRLLVGVALFGVALGPAIVAMSPDGHSPLTLVSSMMWTPALVQQYLERSCVQGGEIQACHEAIQAASDNAVAAMVAALVPLMLQAVLSFGLAKGRRVAWWMSLALQIGTIAILLLQLESFSADIDDATVLGLNVFWLLVPWLASIVLLLVTRRWFFVDVDKRGWRAFWIKVAALGLVSATFVVVAFLVATPDTAFSTAFGHAISKLPEHFVPLSSGWMGDSPTRVMGHRATVISLWAANLFWFGLAIATWQLISTVPDAASAQGRRRMLAMLEEGSGDHLSWMTLWQNNRYWFSDDPSVPGAVAYQVRKGIAVTVGEPVCGPLPALEESEEAHGHELAPAPEQHRLQLARAFALFAHQQGWQVAWYSVREEFALELDADGFKRLHVAEESIMNCENTEFKGKKFQNIRTARNRAGKEGVSTVWGSWEEIGPELQRKVEELSEAWVAEKALPEMGFTLGTLEELRVEGTMLLLAVDDEGTLHGVTSWLPVYEQGHLVGFTLDFMRRNARGFRPVIEFLLAEATVRAKEAGCSWISLSGAPLAPSKQAGDSTDALGQLLNLVGEMIEPLYGFRSLAFSKNKFHPEHQGWYLCYNDELALPSIGLAVTQCYLPQMKVEDASNVMKTWWASKA
ncbi:phosphatidylglycerol lysyltransferase domain-containing protein [Corynebacterium gerontici]|uniref:Phosphatidylglycerol lysyltransferase n=1 Tax=Corynebacterium gerontici TaxID=2079234 RepID=A0A3G6J5T0_9CORY|nr:phosphatidylglycerol lysyltransferase domain-containing protein [Corynebacterium gerontici]AZA11374.1 Phosphatidylglycerol lysyltransferase [Corynebacterium gerontici]